LIELSEWITTATQKGAVPVLTGKNGDMDTIGSAIALAASNPAMIACGLHQGRLAARLCTKLDAPFRKLSENPSWPEKIGGIIVVDAAGPSQVGVKLPEDVPLCIIDHHSTSDWKFSSEDLEINIATRSTTQIVHSYLSQYSPDTLTDEVRKLLLAGLITDTARFRHADGDALKSGFEIMEGAGFEYQSFIEEIQNENITPSERGAIIKALGRVQSTDAGKWNLVHTHAGILEGKVATILLQTGADVSLVSRNRDGETRLTARATRFSTLSGIHLGKMMKSLTSQLGGEGGGHDGAAGWSGKSERIAAESAFINLLANTKRVNN
jgi:nanoRNase/pAp phosphatase (c-di-AMP/oligoRNAs hydrolase)